MLILICTAVGYAFGCRGGVSRPSALLYVLLGTALIASGTSALNQWYESDSDALMFRTRGRPIPAGRLKRAHALMFAVMVSLGGFCELWFKTNVLTAMLGLFTLLGYLFLYTPLKKRSPACTTVGAIPGAMPPLIGYAAAKGRLDWSALALFAILFVWQFPHFYAIAWMHRDDYARGGIRMLPVIDLDGAMTAKRVVACSLLLIPVSLLPRFLGMTGSTYFIAAVVGGIGLLCFGMRLRRECTAKRARQLLLASVLYLPAILAVMVIDRSR
jgi:protoheme IX farnesyltransferase